MRPAMGISFALFLVDRIGFIVMVQHFSTGLDQWSTVRFGSVADIEIILDRGFPNVCFRPEADIETVVKTVGHSIET
jgi:hypothetical protein